MKAYFPALCLIPCACEPQPTAPAWQPLVNGESLDDWTLYLGRPHPDSDVPGLARDSSGRYADVLGVGHDPLGVYSVVEEDGEAAIHVSGEVFGVMVAPGEFGDAHISVQFKWGEKKWPPRMDLARDAGLLYHGFGQPGEVNDNWNPAQECQIQEGDCGDYWPVGLVTMEIPAEMDTTMGFLRYAEGGNLRKMFFSNDMTERRVLKYPDNERPRGEWNTIEVLTKGDSSIHLVNGQVVMRLFRSSRVVEGQEVPLTSGQISLQSEGAEIFYRDIKVKPIPKEMALEAYLEGM